MSSVKAVRPALTTLCSHNSVRCHQSSSCKVTADMGHRSKQ